MKEKNAEISERLKQLLEILDLNPNSFAKLLGYERSQAIYDMLNGKAAPSFDFFNKVLLSEYSDIINIRWIISGEGEPLMHTDTGNSVRSYAEEGYERYDQPAGIPLIPGSALAGAGAGELVLTEHEIEHRYIVPEFAKADFLIRVKGSSMYPKYSAGDLLACVRMNKDHFIQWNKTYVLDTTQGIMVKRIVKGNHPGHWILRSDNKDYQDIDVHPDEDVHGIHLVVGVIRLE